MSPADLLTRSSRISSTNCGKRSSLINSNLPRIADEDGRCCPAARLGDLICGARVKGILPGRVLAVVDLQWDGPAATLTYAEDTVRTGCERLLRDRETRWPTN